MLGGILPGQLREVVVPPGAVRRADKANPVDHRTVRRRGREAIRLADRPRRQHAAAAAAGHEHVALVDEAFFQELVDAGHQVVVILARIRVVDPVAELAAVAGAAARVGVEDHVAVCGHLLPSVVEADAVHAVRTAVDVQLHGVLLGGVEVGRRDVPALDLQSIRRRVPHLRHRTELLALENVVVDRRQLFHLLGLRDVIGHDVGRLVHRAQHADSLAGFGNARRGEHVGALGHRLHHIRPDAGHRQHVQVLAAGILRREIHAGAVGFPLHVLRRSIPVTRHQARVAAVDVHHVQLGVGPRVARRVDARIGHEFAVGRHPRVVVGALAPRQLRDGAGVDGNRVDFGFAELVFGIGHAQRREKNLLAVGRELDAVVIPVAGGQLARRAAGGRHHEQVSIAIVIEALSVLAVVEPLDDARRVDPLGALRTLRHLDRPVVLLLDLHRKRDRLSVGGPCDIGRRLGEMRDLRRRALGVHVADEDLRALRIALRGVNDAIAARRPARAAAADQEAVLAPVRAHDPERRFALVVDLVDPAARVDDLRAVRRQLRIGDRLVLPIKVEVQAIVRNIIGSSGVLGGDDRRQRGESESDEDATHRPSSSGRDSSREWGAGNQLFFSAWRFCP